MVRSKLARISPNLYLTIECIAKNNNITKTKASELIDLSIKKVAQEFKFDVSEISEKNTVPTKISGLVHIKW